MRKKLPLDLDLVNMIDPSQPIQIIVLFLRIAQMQKIWLTWTRYQFTWFLFCRTVRAIVPTVSRSWVSTHH